MLHIFCKFKFLYAFVCKLRDNKKVFYVIPNDPVGEKLAALVDVVPDKSVKVQRIIRGAFVSEKYGIAPLFKLPDIFRVVPLNAVYILEVVHYCRVGFFESLHKSSPELAKVPYCRGVRIAFKVCQQFGIFVSVGRYPCAFPYADKICERRYDISCIRSHKNTFILFIFAQYSNYTIYIIA